MHHTLLVRRSWLCSIEGFAYEESVRFIKVLNMEEKCRKLNMGKEIVKRSSTSHEWKMTSRIFTSRNFPQHIARSRYSVLFSTECTIVHQYAPLVCISNQEMYTLPMHSHGRGQRNNNDNNFIDNILITGLQSGDKFHLGNSIYVVE